VRIWWSLNPPREPMNLLFCAAHRSTHTEDSTPAPGDLRFGPRDNWGTASHEEWPVARRCRTLRATRQSRGLPPQSQPPHRGPPGAVIPQKRLGEHTASIGRRLANQSQSPMSLLIRASVWQTGGSRPRIPALHRLLVSKLLSLVLTWALVF